MHILKIRDRIKITRDLGESPRPFRCFDLEDPEYWGVLVVTHPARD